MSAGLSRSNMIIKRAFDVFLSFILLVLFSPVIFVVWMISCCDTYSNGFFFQTRVGLQGKLFTVIKIKTMIDVLEIESSVSALNNNRITPVGKFLRRYKLDELPQLINVFVGNMSFVGPRPDIPGFADMLNGADRAILLVRPGITGPASLKYREEEELLSQQNDPESYNRDVIWPDKVSINLEYIRNWSLRRDIHYIFKTVFN